MSHFHSIFEIHCTAACFLTIFMAIFCQMKTLDPRVDTRLDRLFATAMTKLGKASEKHYMDYIERKVTAWYAKFPPKQDDPAAAAAEEAASERAPVEAGGQSAAVEDEAEGLEMSDVE
jgi:hypothetical protein